MLNKPVMYNLRVSTAAATASGAGVASGAGSAGLLGVDFQGLTPRTPEILNSLIAMSNPLESYPIPTSSAGAPELNSPSGALSDCSSCSGSVTSPPSIQRTRTQLIKEGLKLTLQTKRRHVSGDTNTDDEDEGSPCGKRLKKDELTAEDEERRRRRRERNKVAATKCRIKKRERTTNLVQESEILESQNYELKSQIQELETQRRRLVDMLSTHTPTCTRPTRDSPDLGEAAGAAASFPYEAFAATPYSCPSPGAAHPHPHAPAAPVPAITPYSDMLLDHYDTRVLTPLDPMVNAGAGAARCTPPLSYYPVAKHEVPDDPLLSGFEDDLSALTGEPGFDCGPGSFGHPGHGGALGGVLGHGGLGMPQAQPQMPYCRPSSLALDPAHGLRPGSSSTEGPRSSSSSLDSPGAGAGQAGYQHYQHPQLTQLVHQEGAFGMDSGCMA